MPVEGMTDDVLVFIIILVALVLFVSEFIPNDMTAIGVIVTLAALELVTPTEAIQGFANPATITILAMYMLSAGIQKSGLVDRLGIAIARVTAGDERKTLAATVISTSSIAGFINNTPVVALFIPLVTDLANRNQISPSKLLMPLSFAAILGGTLTLIGTSTNLLASTLTAELLDRGPIGFFEFTHLGIIIVLVGGVYLLTVGRWLVPGRLPAAKSLTEAFGLEDYLFQVSVREKSSLVGTRLVEYEEPPGVDIIQLERGSEMYPATTDLTVEPGDRLVLLGRFADVDTFAKANNLLRLYGRSVDDATFKDPLAGGTLAKLVVTPDSDYLGVPLGDCRLERRYETTVLAVNRGTELVYTDLDNLVLSAGDTLLVRSNTAALAYLDERGDLLRIDAPPFDLLKGEEDEVQSIDRNAILAIGVMAGVVGLAALGILPIVIAALLGVVAMVLVGTLRPSEAYDAVSWKVIFLIAGVLPLGTALTETGGAERIANLIIQTGDVLPILGVLFIVVILTGLLANVITPVATVVLMIPVAVDAAIQLGANGFAFLLAVMFASATSFMTPVGYQTNLMISTPGRFQFVDFLRVGAPLQLLTAIVITLGIWFFWGLTP